MRFLGTRSVMAVSVVLLGNCAWAASTDRTGQDLAAARRTGWQAAITIVENLESNPQPQFPGIEAWCKDFRQRTAGLDPQAPVETWPRFDAESLMTRNPSFWQAFYEIAPGDAGLALLQAGLLLSSGEVVRALHVLEFQQFRAGTPRQVSQVISGLLATTQQAKKESDAHVEAGIALFDAGNCMWRRDRRRSEHDGSVSIVRGVTVTLSPFAERKATIISRTMLTRTSPK